MTSNNPTQPVTDAGEAGLGSSVHGEVEGTAGRIKLIGEIDYAGAPQLDAEVARLLGAGAKQLTVDFSGVSFFDSACLSALVRARESAQEAGGELVLTHLSKYALRILEIAGVTTLFTVTNSPA
ncbi:STAS domain-containing protein [Allokutzneria albata]|uniref:Anti-sigma factor antagonist n=1 Tax=Allokutzneria albata TaxID=211114 RepID=A0A1H0CDV3_ALLAB|nr:STAS domain-containing protein [Allokutzneria albata]SDN56040.1 anti-anti-sigma factor [Allokutzneria albata]